MHHVLFCLEWTVYRTTFIRLVNEQHQFRLNETSHTCNCSVLTNDFVSVWKLLVFTSCYGDEEVVTCICFFIFRGDGVLLQGGAARQDVVHSVLCFYDLNISISSGPVSWQQ